VLYNLIVVYNVEWITYLERAMDCVIVIYILTIVAELNVSRTLHYIMRLMDVGIFIEVGHR
jgi:hypothetical protein